MLKNNNRHVVRHMAGSALKGNKGRSAVLFLAIVLSSFMVFCVLTVGSTYFEMWRLQNLRLRGAEYDALMYGCTDEQMKKLRENEEVERIGIFAIAGYVDETEVMAVTEIPLAWVDEVYWNEMAAGARTFLEGRYPAAENEILVTKQALKSAGMEDAGIGDSFTAGWVDGDGQERVATFQIAGIWDGYGSKNLFFVSRAFYKKSGRELSDVGSGRILLELRRKLMTKRQQSALVESLVLGKAQRFLYEEELGRSVPIALGLAGLILVTCLCAYLLIYNIMYLSVTGNIRYYGLLQTVGMTERQIRSFIYQQMSVLGGLGAAAGIFAGSGVSFLAVPSLIRAFGISQKVEVRFHLSIFFLTIALVSLTVYVGSRKPAKLAAVISPVEASHYQSGPAGRERLSQRTGQHSILWRMGGRKAFRDKKRAAVITLSLSVGISVFLCVFTLVESQGPRTILSNAWADDMEISNITLRSDEREKWEELLTDDLIRELKEIDGVREVRTIETAEAVVPWEADFVDLWLKEMYETWGYDNYESEREAYQKNTESLITSLVGIDERNFAVLNEYLDEPIDEQAFLEGKTCVIFRDALAFRTEDLQGKTICAAEPGNTDHTFRFAIAGLTDDGAFLGPVSGMLPAIIISKEALGKLGLTTYQYKAILFYEEEYDEETEAAVKSLLELQTGGEYFRCESKLERMEEVKAAQGNMLEVGIGVSLILALIGIMNYINTVIGNIESRQKELAILESIGMTQRQIHRMLVREGVVYAIGAVILTLVAGIPVIFGLYQMMNDTGVPFSVPVLPAALILLAMFTVCICVPVVLVHGVSRKGTVIERIRERGRE